MGSALSGNLEVLFGKMESFVSSKTVVGDPVQIGGVIIVPLVDVAFGMAAGASENAEDEKKAKKDASAGGIGGKITPSAVLVIMNDTVQLVNVKNTDSVNKLIDMVPGILSKLNLGSLFGKKDDAEASVEEIIEAE